MMTSMEADDSGGDLSYQQQTPTTNDADDIVDAAVDVDADADDPVTATTTTEAQAEAGDGDGDGNNVDNDGGDDNNVDGDVDGPEGCYLTFETTSGGRLMLVYSRGDIPSNAVGFWCPGPGHSIQGFKFKQAGGKSELIKGIAGGDQNRRKYFSGWCQFIKLAKAMNGYVIKFPNAPQGVEVDVVGYKTAEEKAYELDLDAGLLEVGGLDAVAVVPKHNPTFHGIHTINKTNFIEMGQLAGAATTL